MNKSVLDVPLPSESHQTEELRKAIAEAEALGHQTAIAIGAKEKEIAALESEITDVRCKVTDENANKKVAIIDAAVDGATRELVHKRTVAQAELRYLKNLGGLIENRCSVGQSFLSNTTAQMKAGINFGE